MTFPPKTKIILSFLLVALVAILLLVTNTNNPKKVTQVENTVINTWNENKDDETEFTTYINQRYNFSLTFPESFPLIQSPEKARCQVIINDINFPQAETQEVDLPEGTSIPIAFEEITEEGDFFGHVYYVLLPKCVPIDSLVNVQVIEKDPNFSFDSFIDKTKNSISMDGAAGGTVKKLLLPVNGKDITVIREGEGSVTRPTKDTYYFDHGPYVYILDHSYSGFMIEEELSDSHRKELARNFQHYELSKQIISGFEFLKTTNFFVVNASSGINIPNPKFTVNSKTFSGITSFLDYMETLSSGKYNVSISAPNYETMEGFYITIPGGLSDTVVGLDQIVKTHNCPVSAPLGNNFSHCGYVIDENHNAISNVRITSPNFSNISTFTTDDGYYEVQFPVLKEYDCDTPPVTFIYSKSGYKTLNYILEGPDVWVGGSMSNQINLKSGSGS